MSSGTKQERVAENMNRSLMTTVAMCLLAVSSVADSARAFEFVGRGCRRANQSWHGGYYHPAWGMPVALVVPPTAEAQTDWGWGVGNTQITTICPQFGRKWPGPGLYDRGAFSPTPAWPSHTDQFGVYYVRGPW